MTPSPDFKYLPNKKVAPNIKDLVKVHWLGETEKGMVVGRPQLVKKSYGDSVRYPVQMQDGRVEMVVPSIITKRKFRKNKENLERISSYDPT